MPNYEALIRSIILSFDHNDIEMSFLGNSMLTIQEKQKYCTAFHGFNMMEWAINIGERKINKTAILPKWTMDRNYGMAIFEAIFWWVCNQPIK